MLWAGADRAGRQLDTVQKVIESRPDLCSLPDLLALAKLANDAAGLLRKRLERERTGAEVVR